MTLQRLYPKLTDRHEEPNYPCVLCGARYIRVELPYDSGSVAPTVGETLTGATSTDTGVVVSTSIYSGAVADGDAAGFVELSSPTGVDQDAGTSFQDNELITGSTGGSNMMTVNGDGHLNRYGRLYPESMLVERDGKRYCTPHYIFRYTHIDTDEFEVDVTDDDRESEEL